MGILGSIKSANATIEAAKQGVARPEDRTAALDGRRDYGPQGCAENFTVLAAVATLLFTLVRKGAKR